MIIVIAVAAVFLVYSAVKESPFWITVWLALLCYLGDLPMEVIGYLARTFDGVPISRLGWMVAGSYAVLSLCSTLILWSRFCRDNNGDAPEAKHHREKIVIYTLYGLIILLSKAAKKLVSMIWSAWLFILDWLTGARKNREAESRDASRDEQAANRKTAAGADS